MYNKLKRNESINNIDIYNMIFFKNSDYIGLTNKAIEIIKKQTARILELENKALFDHLTGVYNRYGLEEKIKEYFKNNQIVTVITIDIKDLGKINNKYGYISGDEAIKNTAEVIKKFFRWNKKNRKEDIIARFGGDEFIIILEEINKVKLLEKICFIKKEILKIDKCTKYDFEIHINYNNNYTIDNYKIANEENHYRLKETKLKEA